MMIELRSDTLTLPTQAMREAVATAVLGDDVYGEDPTVFRVEELSTAILDKEAACLMPSGTMANLAAIMAHCARGTKVIVGDESDIYLYEAGGASVCGGVMYHSVPTQPDGRLALDDLVDAFGNDADDSQFAPAALLCLEQTHNRSGGRALRLQYLDEAGALAHDAGVPLHLDGARLFNAALALGTEPARLARCADSVQFCLSKGLGAPIGSILVGDGVFIERARRIRKMLGGGMRQAGIIAAAGIYGLEHMVDRLEEDHATARRLAEGLAGLPGIEVDPTAVETNIVLFRVVDERFNSASFIDVLWERGVRMGEFGHGRIRAVTHLGIRPEDVVDALTAVQETLRRGPSTRPR